MAFSRLHLYVHYLTDVLTGIVLGPICSGIIIFLFNKVSYINHNTKPDM
ncbi:hypothetical protein LGK95_21470 [Clostridium algoriphilum]|nr:hypothetical protein [Clostridium algoriphilum]